MPPQAAQARPGRAERVLQASEAVRAARCRYAEAFLRFKIRDVTDGQAHQQAVLETGAELTVLEARLFLAQEEVRHPTESAGA